MSKKLSTLEALAILIGTQIGAGILGLPYALKDLGFWSVPVVVAIGFLTLITAMVVLELSSAYEGNLSEITRKVLGNLGGVVMFLSVSILIYGAMIAYVASSGELINDLFGIPKSVGSIIFWLVLSYVIFTGIKLSGEVELGLNFVLLAAMVIAIFMVAPKVSLDNLSHFNPKAIIPSVGVVAFAFVSHMLVPEIRRGLNDEIKTRRVVVWGFVVPMIFYSSFVFFFLGAFGNDVPEIVTTVLSEKGLFGEIIGVILPLAAIATSYIGVGYAQMRGFEGYFKTNRFLSWILTTLPPLLIYFLGLKSFVKALWLGGTFGGIIYAGLLPVVMYFKACSRNVLKDVLVLMAGGVFVVALFGAIL